MRPPYLLWQLLHAGAQRAPAAPALIDGARALTYAELDDLSARLAGVLRAHGVGSGSRVALHLPKSAAALVALLAVLRAGAAYVPLDVNAPPARNAGIVADCAPVALLHGPGGPPPFAPPGAAHLAVDLAALGDMAPLPAAACSGIETDLAYILYTSGSTGQPKGVMIDQRAALTFVQWAADYVGLTAADRLASHAPLHFDLSIFDIFGALAAGASVALVPAQTALFPYSLAQWIAAQRISVWYSVPFALVQLALHGDLAAHDLRALRAVLFAGEPFPVPHLRTLQRLLPHAALYNLYGPTETNVCTAYPVPPPAAGDDAPIPIGRACANYAVFALDDDGVPVETPGVLGELYVRGPGLMRGYLRRPEQTAAVLLPNPLDPDSGELVYRTGDLVTRDAGGAYIFCGRRDRMVKSRGYRIELGEIEAAAYRHPAVAEAAAVARPDADAGARLLLAVVARPGQALTAADVLACCRDRLPTYMLPHAIALRPALPRTATGKIDRLQLQVELEALAHDAA